MTLRSAARRVREVLFSKQPTPTLTEVPPLPDATLDGQLDALEEQHEKTEIVKRHAHQLTQLDHVRLLSAPIDQQIEEALIGRRR